MGRVIEAYTAADVRSAEEPLLAAERGFHGGLMHRAATALAGVVREELAARAEPVVGSTVVALVGRGNNGGDALHAMAVLAGRGADVTALALGPLHEGGLVALRTAGGRVLAVADDAPGTPVWVGDAVAEAFAADVLLDGLLGIGGRGGLREPAASLVELLDPLLAEAGDAGPTVVAVDLPSGIGVDDGTVPGPVLPADRTVTFGVPKPGLLLPPAAPLAGVLSVVDLALTDVLVQHGARPAVLRVERPDLVVGWPRPALDDHKYSRGVLGVLAGSAEYPGAAVLTVAGAQGGGVGMVRYVGPPDVTHTVLAAHPEVVAGDGRVQAWVIGPGLAGERLGVARERLAAVLRDGAPVVVDAGALDLLPERAESAVLTPHAGELAALLRGRGADVAREDVEAEPLRWAREAHARTGSTVLLKGAVTLVVAAEAVYAQGDATPWLATAGAGDVLAGLLGALLATLAAQAPGESLLPDELARAAAMAASVHGRAAVAASGGGPVTASRVASAVPAVLAGLLG
ncbi:bifunctional ADP-dependent NAD(P)H-hydrate dehydratase/NAD(P)H-hydrate epimerase [Actinotalea sp. M2MS4P-6]|uniref:bifunctional ADP-dependent NAD(P)H-hydrate dehydratase/NAD(P)H-hydrate epimerase n=1 Tax=Actinotalea sp. M2MS4P-6 TaxID=2983762 RepID=UPI0021E3E62F|nr:bifunctional ADP-dependent NAD(P)H-hydrate dehydratase/NAD(P)H-hydrate epimerase [Actinotalea sp. M2MS4P-6]MCV2395521.1 bifunctional ADP-dependent NAD(P)H-hydrate dehydratase/NAD(P)H-hydrate epimerase [Actinotalea sp. M2MS4P-6]